MSERQSKLKGDRAGHHMTKILITLIGILFTTQTVLAAKTEKRTITSRGKERIYYLFVPDTVNAARPSPSPLLITLHGSKRNGASLVDNWKGLAEKEGIIVAGPDSTNSAHWAAPEDGPVLLRDLVEKLKAEFPIDGRRVYLFGHSGGARFALQIALLESEYFAATAIHAGALDEKEFSLTSFATRKIPFAIVIGTDDAFFPLKDVRATRDHLQKQGFEVALTEVLRHTHDYYSKAGIINRMVWDVIKNWSLPNDAKFTDYANLR